ncbi:MAG: DUF1501 domain-containing protein [Planctomycetota bacterium]|jgi:hypothetical protein|nr:DUF1501 domain-containing protein [Planctomycetota bacterium]
MMERRQFLSQALGGFGGLALGSLALTDLLGAHTHERRSIGGLLQDPQGPGGGLAGLPHFAPKAKRVIYLHMAGSPSQLDLFDPKPKLKEFDGRDIPESFIAQERFAFIKGTPKVLASPYEFKQHGESGQWISELLPHTAAIADKLTVVRSMTTTQFNHAPAQLFLNTGHPLAGRPSLGSWLSYGLGNENQNLPAFVVMLSGKFGPSAGATAWSNGFLPSQYQGVRLHDGTDPVLFLSNPEGVSTEQRRRELDALGKLNRKSAQRDNDAETLARIEQYELAFRMQREVPKIADLTTESAETLEMYGVEPGKPSFASNCLFARRLAESGVRFIQLYDWGWDSHGTNPSDDIITSLPEQCRRTDMASAALVTDLERRGLLDDTLVVWGGEFGRTPMNEKRNGSTYLGRDHHPHAFTMWFAGGGMKPGVAHGATDEFGYFTTEDKVDVHDLHATMLHLLGVDHERLTYTSQGRPFRLTDVAGNVIHDLLA